MINLEGKYISTRNNNESSELLKMAIAQGYKLPCGEKVLESERLFRFFGSPICSVYIPSYHVKADGVERFCDLFGDEKLELGKIVDDAMRWCRERGYDHIAIYANNEETKYTGKAIAKNRYGAAQHYKGVLEKPVKVSLKDVEELFGYPIEIVS